MRATKQLLKEIIKEVIEESVIAGFKVDPNLKKVMVMLHDKVNDIFKYDVDIVNGDQWSADYNDQIIVSIPNGNIEGSSTRIGIPMDVVYDYLDSGLDLDDIINKLVSTKLPLKYYTTSSYNTYTGDIDRYDGETLISTLKDIERKKELGRKQYADYVARTGDYS